MDGVFMIVGFMLASYAVVANDAIQTLGTFLAANHKRPWWQLWAFAGGILFVVMMYGWWGGDVSYGRLDKYPLPEPFTWIYVVPPLALLALTRFGVPVSTTFLVLTVFAPKNLESMLTKSLLGYAVAFGAAVLLYGVGTATIEKRFLDTRTQSPPTHWVVLQWLSTAFLWGQWLVQDLANIFVYLPRDLSMGWMVAALGWMLLVQMYTFYTAGGEIQKVVTSKTNTTDIRSATIINFVFGVVLYIFKELSNIPMSTTWVFLGLLAGREIALSFRLSHRPMAVALRLCGIDVAKAFAGLAVSIVVALGLPVIAAML